ncbi:hypothetical protein ACSNOI_41745 [Actinomadura kijaniata]|uniref:hypothetical protein n=1 Tax=Actinomadura kijaniata TaxID=46161 RepID=UPI003F1DB74E
MSTLTTDMSSLAALAVRVDAYGLRAELTAEGLRVANPNVPGCCEDVRHPSDLITCRPRSQDGDRLWFWTSWGEPLAPVHRLDDALVRVRSYLSRADHDRDQEDE